MEDDSKTPIKSFKKIKKKIVQELGDESTWGFVCRQRWGNCSKSLLFFNEK